MPTTAPNWAEPVVAVATAILALGVAGAVAAAVFGAQQVRRRGAAARPTWPPNLPALERDSLVESRRLVARFSTPEELASAFQRYIAADAPEAHLLYRELDYCEQLAALERCGGFDLAARIRDADRGVGGRRRERAYPRGPSASAGAGEFFGDHEYGQERGDQR